MDTPTTPPPDVTNSDPPLDLPEAEPAESDDDADKDE